jgi:hypothetical protein
MLSGHDICIIVECLTLIISKLPGVLGYRVIVVDGMLLVGTGKTSDPLKNSHCLYRLRCLDVPFGCKVIRTVTNK